MPQKKISDLQLVGSVTDSLMFPSDNGLQSYRATAAQLFTYIRALLKPFSDEIANVSLTASVGSSALTIAVKTQAGTDPSSTDKIRVAFRSSTLSSGAFNIREITGALSLVISSGSTLGQASGQAGVIYVYLLDAGSSPELAVSRKMFSEDELVSTTAEGGAGAADSGTVMYSSTARSNVSCRLIGYLVNTQATAGTWATAPSQIQLMPFQGRKTPTVQRFTSGSGTYNTPAGCRWIRVRMVGPGGGGSAGNVFANGSNGSASTTWGGVLTAGFGGGSTGNGAGSGGSAVTSAGIILQAVSGGDGQHGGTSGSLGGQGGQSFFGGAGSGGYSGTIGGTAAKANTGAGGGGGGATGGGNAGGGGGAGAFIDAIFVNPDPTYSYAVGAGGAGGTNGTGNGGAGGSGVIIVEEYY